MNTTKLLLAFGLCALASGMLAMPAQAQCETLVFSEDFEGGLPPGWQATGLWHLASGCTPAGTGGQCLSGQNMYFGVDGQCNYEASPLSGKLSTRPIQLPSLPNGGTIVLDYCEAESTECEVEIFELWVEEIGGPTTKYNIRCNDFGFEGGTPPYPLTPFAGKQVRLHWYFDAVDNLFNQHNGIHIDNITVKAYDGAGPDCNQNLIPDDCEIQMGSVEDCDGNLQPDECQGLSVPGLCSAKWNSTGAAAWIDKSGSQIHACNNLKLQVGQAPPGQIGLFIYSADWSTETPFGNGFLCLAGSIIRLNPGVVIDANGNASYAVDLTQPPAVGTMLPGSAAHFQFWFRDPAAGGAQFNLSDRMAVVFAL